jgi:alkanesulfonate monooxygenase SsuD/methylene tetrahydromethanopterin reductase-like flavin-dependent oxidoreductase (luciferase family)
MLSEHIVLGPDAGAGGVMGNPREYAMPGNQDPATPWPSSPVLLSAIAAVTSRIRLIAAAIIAPLRHPIAIAKEIATLDLLSGGRLVVQPTVSWHPPEYGALGVPWHRRGDLLDEHLAAWNALWRESPASFAGRNYAFEDVWFEPKPHRADGPTVWLGGSTLHDRLLRRIVAYADGFHPLGRPSEAELASLREAMSAAGRDVRDLEMVGGMRGRFPSPDAVADVGEALATVPDQIAQGFTSFCFKPSQFTDDVEQVGPLCRRIVERVAEMARDAGR